MGKLNPALVPLLALAAGIIFSPGHTLLFTAVVVAAAVVCFLLRKYRYGVIAAIAAAGALSVSLAQPPHLQADMFEIPRDYLGLVERVTDGSDGESAQVDILNGDRPFRIALYCDQGELAAGDTVLFSGVLRNPDAYGDMPFMDSYALWARANGISASIFCKGTEVRVTGTSRSLKYLPERLAARFEDFIYSAPFSPETAAVLSAVLVGRERVPESIAASFRTSGTAHLLCISGFHIGLLIALLTFVLWPLKIFEYGWKWVIIIAGALVWLYVCITGFQPPAVRAATMYTVFAVVRITERDASSLNVLAISAFIILLVKPLWIWSAGFQLSLSAVAAIIVFAPKFTVLDARYGWQHRLNVVFAVALAAAIGTAPVLAFHFHNVPLLSVVANVAAVTVFPVFICAALLCLALTAVGIPSLWAGRLTDRIFDIIDAAAFTGTRFDVGLSGLYPRIPVLMLCVMALVAAAVALHHRKTAVRIAAASAGLVCLCLTACVGPGEENMVYVHRSMILEVNAEGGRIVTTAPRRSRPAEYLPFFEGNGVAWGSVRMEHAADSIVHTCCGEVPVSATRTENALRIR